MKINISGRNMTVNENLKEMIDKKIGRLSKFFQDDTICNVTATGGQGLVKIEVTIPVKGTVIRAEQLSSDKYEALDLVTDIIERQIRRYRTRLLDKKKTGADFSEFYENEMLVNEDGDDDLKIERVKHFDIKPMTPEEACLEMELLGHDFFLFMDGNTGKASVVYKRKGNTYGLIDM